MDILYKAENQETWLLEKAQKTYPSVKQFKKKCASGKVAAVQEESPH